MSEALREEDLEITFFRASGPGGQHRNRRETGVRIRHLPTGIVVSATERRSQADNRAAAMERLIDALARRNRKKKRRIATRATRASQERRLLAKKRHAEVKSGRGKVSGE
ncbi:MAG: peptide chain release factor-like protein [Deferrisomatales bacterium]